MNEVKHFDIGVMNNCQNLESYGVICVKCNKCGRFGKEKQIYDDIKIGLKQAIDYEKNTWVVSENGCVITCPKCGERLELCYPDGTEVRYLPHCPWCGKKMERGNK